MNSIKRSYIIILISGFLVSLIPLALETQDSVFKSIFTTLILFIWFVSAFIFGIPSLRSDVRDRLTISQSLLLLWLMLLLPYIGLLLFGLSLRSTILIFMVWYVLPTTILSAILLFYDKVNSTQRLLFIGISAILFWIGFDHRYTRSLFDVFEGLSYVMNAFWIVSLMMTAYGWMYGITQEEVEADKGLSPTFEGIKIAQIASIGISIIIVPIGLFTGFLSWNPDIGTLFDVLVGFIGIYLTIAFQEELVFRGVLLHEADLIAEKYETNKLIPLIITSILFGLTHWNNEAAQYIPHYIILASVAGIGYGWAYRKGGMFSAMITHTLVDWVWSMFLTRIGS